jgi:hypothetical protein
VTDWTPATEAEVAMREALDRNDQERYFELLAGLELLLPVSADELAGRAPSGWGTWTVGGRTHVLAFTSPEAMRACLAEHAGSARRVPFHELAAAWPNLDWWLAVNPGLPIEGYLPAWYVSQLARGDARLPGRSSTAAPERAETLGRASVPAPAQRRPEEAAGAGAERPPETTVSGAHAPTGAGSAPVPVGQGAAAAPPAPAAAAPGAAAPGGAAPGGGAATTGQPTAPPSSAPATAKGTQPAFKPANDLEQQLLDAAGGGLDLSLSILLLAKVLLPVADGADPAVRPGDPVFQWRTDKRDGNPCVSVFTSPELLAAHLGGPVPAHGVRFVQLIRSWPDPSWSLTVNPGTPIEVTLPPAQIATLAASATEVGLDDDAGEAGESGTTQAAQAARRSATGNDLPPMMQKAIAPSQVAWYLERSYDRVSGFVHRAAEVAHLRTPAQIIRGLGLRYEGSPFVEDASEIYVLRWPAFVPSLYRIPYGGRTEAAMAAMEGWVIERAPFRGNGFAPSDSGDVIAEFKVDSVRLPHGAQLWRLGADGSSRLVARLDADGPTWVRVGEE